MQVATAWSAVALSTKLSKDSPLTVKVAFPPVALPKRFTSAPPITLIVAFAAVLESQKS